MANTFIEQLTILSEPFMVRALTGGLVVAILCSILGVFIVLTNKSFITDGIAHSSLAGIAGALALSITPIWGALTVGIIMAVGITYFRKKLQLSHDALIGILFSSFFALGIIILYLSPSQKEVSTYLFGRILSINAFDNIIAFLILVSTSVIVFINYKKILYTIFDPEAAFIRGVKTEAFEYLINILVSIATIIAVKLVGVILVTSLFITPASTAKLVSKKFSDMIPYSTIFAIFATVIGIIFSIIIDVPPGATIVLTASSIFIITAFLKQFTDEKPSH